jgi:hypothetical protein
VVEAAGGVVSGVVGIELKVFAYDPAGTKPGVPGGTTVFSGSTTRLVPVMIDGYLSMSRRPFRMAS